MTEQNSTQGKKEAEDETHAESARVQAGYEFLDAEATKSTYEELNHILDGLASTVVHTIDQMVPYLAAMQSLLSQRGADRNKVMKGAGLPGWTEWSEEFAAKFHCSVRTIQEHIRIFHTGKKKRENHGNPTKKNDQQEKTIPGHSQVSRIASKECKVESVLGGDPVESQRSSIPELTDTIYPDQDRKLYEVSVVTRYDGVDLIVYVYLLDSDPETAKHRAEVMVEFHAEDPFEIIRAECAREVDHVLIGDYVTFGGHGPLPIEMPAKRPPVSSHTPESFVTRTGTTNY